MAQRDREINDEVAERIEATGYENSFFIHNSGAYVKEAPEINHLYCPLLAAEADPAGRSYRMVNWGLVPQLKTIHRSPLLYYTQVRDASEGVIELTWVVHNFSVRDDMIFDYVNAPWGGTRITSLPHRFVSSADGNLISISDRGFGTNIHRVNDTGGWAISCADEEADSPSLAIVFGLDRNFDSEQKRREAGDPFSQHRRAVFRAGRAHLPLYETQWADWETREENSFRNYDVVEFVPGLKVAPGESIWFRSFLIVGNKQKVMEQAESLVDYVDYGRVDFEASPDDLVCVSPLAREGQAGSQSGFRLYPRPVAGSKPLFLIRQSSTGKLIITTDPYYFVAKEELDLGFPEDHPHYDYYDDAVGYTMHRHDSQWLSLIGFGMTARPGEGDWQLLSEILSEDNFPSANRQHLDLWVEVSDGSE